jgi:LPS O-antigen subunit length determinant protein (WzzB/FepE family)
MITTTDEEFNIFDIIQELFNKKYLLIGVAIFGVILAFIIKNNSITNYDAKFQVRPLTNQDLYVYNIYNQIPEFQETISPDIFFREFVDALKFSNIFEQESSLVIGKNYPTKNYAFNITPDGLISFKYDENDADNALIVLKKSLSSATEKVRNYFLERAQIIIDAENFKHGMTMNMLNDEKTVLTTKLDSVIEKRIYFLEQQAQIAITLDIKESLIPSIENFIITYPSSGQIVDNESSSHQFDDASPFYMRGYKAIEKEIELLVKQKETLAENSNFPTYQSGVLGESLQNQRFNYDTQMVLDGVPLTKNEEFRAVDYYLKNLEIEPNRANFLYISIFLVLFLELIMISLIIFSTSYNKFRLDKLKD